jgi:hypothetical protein
MYIHRTPISWFPSSSGGSLRGANEINGRKPITSESPFTTVEKENERRGLEIALEPLSYT